MALDRDSSSTDASQQQQELTAAELIARTSLDSKPKGHESHPQRRNENALLMKKKHLVTHPHNTTKEESSDAQHQQKAKRRLRNIDALTRIGGGAGEPSAQAHHQPPLAKKRSSFSALESIAGHGVPAASQHALHHPTHNSDPLASSMIARLKLLEEKVKTLESTVKHKDLELKRVKKLGRHHKRENEAFQGRMNDMIEFVEDIAEYMAEASPNHPFHSHIASVAQFALDLEKQDWKLVNEKKEELKLNLGSKRRDEHAKDQELVQHEKRVAGGRIISQSGQVGPAEGNKNSHSSVDSLPSTSSKNSPNNLSPSSTQEPDEYDERRVSDMPPAPRKVNIPLLQQRVSALNATLADEYEIVKNQDGHSQFKQRKEVAIVFYLNGIIIDGGSFRPYEWDITKAFIIDILDGYFPFEFKEKYPNGVPLRIVDLSEETYTRNSEAQKELTSGNIQNLDKLKEEIGKSGAPKNKKEFLERLPKQIVRDGKLINVRQNIASIMGDSLKESELDIGQTEVTCNTEAYAVVTQHKEKNEKPPKHAVLRLKLPKLTHTKLETIFIFMFPEQTIEELRTEIDKHINSQGTLKYSIRCWPNVRLDDNAKSMQAAGLVPNATLFIHQV